MKVLENFDIYARRGDSHGIWIDLQEKAPDGTKTTIPFKEGDTVRFSIKASPYDTEYLVQLTVKTFHEGRAFFGFEPEILKKLAFGTYHYDVELEREDGFTKTIIPPEDEDPPPQFVVTEEIT